MATVDKEANQVLQWATVGEAEFVKDMAEVEAKPDLLQKYGNIIEEFGKAVSECGGTHGRDGLIWFATVQRMIMAVAIAATKVGNGQSN